MSISLSNKAVRQLLQLKRRGFGSWARTRTLSSSSTKNDWRRDTTTGLTDVYVYTPDSQTIWPDPTLGVFASGDPRFTFPGNVGLTAYEDSSENTSSKNEDSIDNDLSQSQAQNNNAKNDVLEVSLAREHQAQTLYSAHDYIHYTSGAEDYVCSNPVLLNKFPSTLVSQMGEVRFELHEAPTLLRKELTSLFPGIDAFQNPNHSVNVITMAHETKSDMSVWSDEMESERELLTEEFVYLAKEICGRVKSDGHWADFIDPSSGGPYFTQQTNSTMFETDDKYRLLGFRIEDLGCCKVICHKDFGRKVFVGTMFTTMSHHGTIQDIFRDLNISHLIAFQSEKRANSTVAETKLF